MSTMSSSPKTNPNTPDTLRKITVAEAHVHSLAPVIQRWAELCKKQADQEPTAALAWYLQGRADAHQMDAARLREALSPTITNLPPKQGISFIKAYEPLLEMMHAITEPPDDIPPNPPNGDNAPH